MVVEWPLNNKRGASSGRIGLVRVGVPADDNSTTTKVNRQVRALLATESPADSNDHIVNNKQAVWKVLDFAVTVNPPTTPP